jgi:hypothetical protein
VHRAPNYLAALPAPPFACSSGEALARGVLTVPFADRGHKHRVGEGSIVFDRPQLDLRPPHLEEHLGKVISSQPIPARKPVRVLDPQLGRAMP